MKRSGEAFDRTTDCVGALLRRTHEECKEPVHIQDYKDLKESVLDLNQTVLGTQQIVFDTQFVQKKELH